MLTAVTAPWRDMALQFIIKRYAAYDRGERPMSHHNEPTPEQIAAVKERHPHGRRMDDATVRKFLAAHTSPHAPPVAIDASAQPGDIVATTLNPKSSPR